MLRIKAPDQPRAFRVPGGMPGFLLVSGLGLLGVLTTLVVSFMPPDTIDVGGVVQYEMTLMAGLVVMTIPPLVWSWIKARAAQRILAAT